MNNLFAQWTYRVKYGIIIFGLTHCTLMDFSIQIKMMRMGLSIVYFSGHRLSFPKYDIVLSLRIVFTLTNSVDPDEMLHYAAFHLGLHCLSK